MSEIQVNTSDLRNGSQILDDASNKIGDVQSQFSRILANIGSAYDGQLRQAIEGIVGGSAQTGARLQNRAIDLGEELLARAARFETANEASRSTVLGASTAYISFIETTPTLRFVSFLSKLKEKALSIWNIGGLATGGFLSLIFVSTTPTILTPFAETQSIPSTNVAEKSGFGELMEKAEQEKQEQAKKEAEENHWWLDVPTQSQQGLNLNGKSTEYGCTPTSTSMILDYWHSKDSSNGTLSAQDLLDTNAKQGEFSSIGMSPSNIHDEVKNLGYSVVEDYTNSDLSGLKDAVAKGPVIAIVKLGMKSTGITHAVVITGISSDNQVKINDPWDGKSYTYSWDDFSKSWGANFGKDAPKNNFVVIRP